MKVALVYDRINKYGGAERVLESLHEVWPEAPLYTSVYHPQKASWASDFNIHPSFLNRIPLFRDKHEYLAPLMPYAFEAFDFSPFDVVISITSAEAKGVITKPNQLHICYMLTPTRYLWSHTHQYLDTFSKKVFLLPFISSLRQWDYIAAQKPDHIIAISQSVQERIQKYYHQDPCKIIYPPVESDRFSKHPKTCSRKTKGYFLIVSRLVSYKNIMPVIKVFNQLPKQKLIIVGTGNQASSLKSIARPNTSFMGGVPDDQLSCLYHHTKALIFPQEEDFGIVAIEAQAAGKPVIALNRGGARETVLNKKTGILLDALDHHNLKQAITAFDHHTWYDKTIRRHANRFKARKFKSTFKQTVEELWQKHQKDQ